MKQSDIEAGGIYGNGVTLRVMTRFDKSSGLVYFTEGDAQSAECCWLSTFARWAKFRVNPGTTPEQLLAMQAKSLRLSLSQQQFLKSLLPYLCIEGRPAGLSCAGIEMSLAGLSFEVAPSEARLIRALERNGLLQYNKDNHQANLTPLGVAYAKNQQQEESQA